MKLHIITRLCTIGAALSLLAGCIEKTGATAPAATPAIRDVRQASAEDETACLNAVAQQTGNTVRVLSSKFSEANSLVMIGVGPASAPWQCLVSQGSVAQVMSVTNEGTL